jgi:hypothetical protein
LPAALAEAGYERGHLIAHATGQPPCIEAMKAVAAHKIDLFGAAGKASLY